MADVSAKDGSQETLVNLAALITSLWLLPTLDGSPGFTWLAFVLFTILHVFANYRAVKAVRMPTLNRTRLAIVLKQFASNGTVPSVEEVNRKEPVVMGFIPTEKDLCGFRVELGQSAQSVDRNALKRALDEYRDRNFALVLDQPSQTFHILLRPKCTAEQTLEAYSVAFLTALTAEAGPKRASRSDQCWTDLRSALVSQGIDLSIKVGPFYFSFKHFSLFFFQGWKVDASLLAPGEWRASW